MPLQALIQITHSIFHALVSRGNLTLAANVSAAIVGGVFTFTWIDYSGDGNAFTTDLAMPLAFNKDKGEAVFSTAAANRVATIATLNLPAGWMEDKVEVDLGLVSSDGKSVENLYLSVNTSLYNFLIICFLASKATLNGGFCRISHCLSN